MNMTCQLTQVSHDAYPNHMVRMVEAKLIEILLNLFVGVCYIQFALARKYNTFS